jgi:hypothetical protein
LSNSHISIAGSWIESVVLVAITTAFVGCGHSDNGTVTGTVLTKDGKPLANARVIARSSESGKAAYGTTNMSGEFKLGLKQEGDGLPAGEYQLSVFEDRGDSDNKRPPQIAPKYSNAATSGLSVKIEDGKSERLELKLDPR